MQAAPDVATDAQPAEFPLFRLIDSIRRGEDAIVEGVERRRERLAAETGLRGLALAERVARELTEEAALKSALIGGAAALPFTLPFLGFLPSVVLTVSLGALLQVANEVELVLAIGAAYRTRIPPERLRIVAFWLVRLSNFDELQTRAMTLGVRVTVRKLIEKLVAIGVTRAVEATAVGMMGGAMVQRASDAGSPWYVRAIAFAGVPVLAWLGWRGTAATGERAIAYFAEELALGADAG